MLIPNKTLHILPSHTIHALSLSSYLYLPTSSHHHHHPNQQPPPVVDRHRHNHRSSYRLHEFG